MDNNPLVSVVMATYNEEPLMIKQAIKSIVDQTYTNWELQIMDDSTKEETREAIDSFSADHRIHIHRFPDRKGFIRSLNYGLECSEGTYIARMDGDDFSLPDRFEKEVAFLEKKPGIMVVGGQINIMDENGIITSSRSYPTGGIKLAIFSCIRNPLAHPTIMMRREVVDSGYKYDESLKMSEDLDLWLRLINDGYKLANIPDTVLNYRVMGNFLEKRSSDTQREVMAQVRKKNFSKKNIARSLLSNMTGWLFTHIPRGAINKAYQNENKR